MMNKRSPSFIILRLRVPHGRIQRLVLQKLFVRSSFHQSSLVEHVYAVRETARGKPVGYVYYHFVA